MRAVIQRVRRAHIEVDAAPIAAIGQGLVVFVGVGVEDSPDDAEWVARKVADLRLFDSPTANFAHSVAECGGEVLVVSQFTLHADVRKGRRPSFSGAAPPEKARELYEMCVATLRGRGLAVQTGQFGARMTVELVNDGPVTIWLDSKARRPGASRVE